MIFCNQNNQFCEFLTIFLIEMAKMVIFRLKITQKPKNYQKLFLSWNALNWTSWSTVYHSVRIVLIKGVTIQCTSIIIPFIIDCRWFLTKLLHLVIVKPFLRQIKHLWIPRVMWVPRKMQIVWIIKLDPMLFTFV